MAISIVKPKWILLQLCQKCFSSGLHMTLECRDIKLWPISGCITMSLVSTPKGRANKQSCKKQTDSLTQFAGSAYYKFA
jgi:hypothetical protein